MHSAARRQPQKDPAGDSFERTYQTYKDLQFDNSSLQPDHGGVGAIFRAEFRKNVSDLAFDSFLTHR